VAEARRGLRGFLVGTVSVRTAQSLVSLLRQPDGRLRARVDRIAERHERARLAAVDDHAQPGRRRLVKVRRDILDRRRVDVVDKRQDSQTTSRLQYIASLFASDENKTKFLRTRPRPRPK